MALGSMLAMEDNEGVFTPLLPTTDCALVVLVGPGLMSDVVVPILTSLLLDVVTWTVLAVLVCCTGLFWTLGVGVMDTLGFAVVASDAVIPLPSNGTDTGNLMICFSMSAGSTSDSQRHPVHLGSSQLQIFAYGSMHTPCRQAGTQPTDTFVCLLLSTTCKAKNLSKRDEMSTTTSPVFASMSFFFIYIPSDHHNQLDAYVMLDTYPPVVCIMVGVVPFTAIFSSVLQHEIDQYSTCDVMLSAIGQNLIAPQLGPLLLIT